MVTAGVVLSSLSRPSANSADHHNEPTTYALGIAMLTVSSLLTGLLGVMQEKTYAKYGKCWQEAVFYTHFLSLPLFVFLARDVRQGLNSLSQVSVKNQSTVAGKSTTHAYAVLGGNLLSQLVCVSGVNQLSSQTNSVTTNIVLTIRKALSLCLSVWWYQTGWNNRMALGAAMVFIGSGLFGIIKGPSTDKVKQQ